jgi:GGDEF domain-containing protein
MAATETDSAGPSAVLVLAIDGLDAFRTAHGDTAARAILARVAHAVRGLTASIGVVAAAYRNGLILLVGPELASEPAHELGETLRTTVSTLDFVDSESIVPNQVAMRQTATATTRSPPAASALRTVVIALV